MKIKLKLCVSEQKKDMEILSSELGYSDEDWDWFDEDTKCRLLNLFVDNLKNQPYWVVLSFKTI